MVGPRYALERLFWVLVVLSWLVIAGPGRGETMRAGEPGFPALDGSWILPLRTGAASPDSAESAVAGFEAAVNGASLPTPESSGYAPLPDGRSVAVIVLFDAIGDAGEGRIATAPWSDALRRRLTGPGLAVSVGHCGPERPRIPSPESGTMPDWPATPIAASEAGARLWDGVIEALTVLSELDAPDRRLLVLVSDGREESASEHVLASCLDAAARARVPVYVLGVTAGPNREAGEARLRDLAERSGGLYVLDDGDLDGNRAEVSAGALCDGIAEVCELRIPLPGIGLPAKVTVRAPGVAGREWSIDVAVRQRLRPPGVRRWFILGAGFLLTAGAATILWRQRNATVGGLLVNTDRGVKRVAIRRDGLTIGSERDNRLRLAGRSVSRHHAVIRWREGHSILTDLRSVRGTTVNGVPVVTHRLADGDRIVVGNEVELVFRAPPPRGRRRT